MARRVNDANQINHSDAPVLAKKSIPKTFVSTINIVKTPAFTTATACRRADTGVGATIAAGSHV